MANNDNGTPGPLLSLFFSLVLDLVFCLISFLFSYLDHLALYDAMLVTRDRWKYDDLLTEVFHVSSLKDISQQFNPGEDLYTHFNQIVIKKR